MVKSRCMACDRDMTMVTEGARPSLGSGLLTAGARSIAPSKVNFSKSKGFLPKINVRKTAARQPSRHPVSSC